MTITPRSSNRKSQFLRTLCAQRGFSPVEAVVSLGILVFLSSIAAPIVLTGVRQSKVETLYENLINTKAAFETYYNKSNGAPLDTSKNLSYLDELIKLNYLSHWPRLSGISAAPILRWELSTGEVFFDIQATTHEGGELRKTIEMLDQIIDDSSLSSGAIQCTAEDGRAGSARISFGIFDSQLHPDYAKFVPTKPFSPSSTTSPAGRPTLPAAPTTPNVVIQPTTTSAPIPYGQVVVVPSSSPQLVPAAPQAMPSLDSQSLSSRPKPTPVTTNTPAQARPR